jgi:hypothetical protein
MTKSIKKTPHKVDVVAQDIGVEQRICTPEKLVEILSTTQNEGDYVFSKRGLVNCFTEAQVFETVVVALKNMKEEVIWFEKILEVLSTDVEYAEDCSARLFHIYTLERERLIQFLEAYDAPIPNATHEE